MAAKKAGKRIDVVDDFRYCSENAHYNQDYQRWRRVNKGPWMYRYTGHQDEAIYVDGKAVPKPNCAKVEQRALMRCSEVIGLALLIFFTVEVVGGTLLIFLMRLLGLNIHLDFLSATMAGSQWAVTVVRAMLVLARYGIPVALLWKQCTIPAHVGCPLRFGGLPESLSAIGAAMTIAGIYSMTDISGGMVLSQTIFTYKEEMAIFTYGLFDVLVASTMAELLLRGALLPLMRQFGDGFAIAVTAIAAFLFPNAMPARISELLIGICAGYLLIRSGSFLKCVLLRVVYTLLTYTRLIQVYVTQDMPLWQYALLLVSMGTLVIAFYVHIRRGKLWLENRRTQLSDGRKLFTLTQTVTMLPWLAWALLMTVTQLFG